MRSGAQLSVMNLFFSNRVFIAYLSGSFVLAVSSQGVPTPGLYRNVECRLLPPYVAIYGLDLDISFVLRAVSGFVTACHACVCAAKTL